MGSKATQAMPASSAMRARTPREVPSVSAMNDGTTAKGLTMVMRAMNDSSATRYNGMRARSYTSVSDIDQAIRINVPDPAAARAAGDARHGAAILLHLLAVARDADVV